MLLTMAFAVRQRSTSVSHIQNGKRGMILFGVVFLLVPTVFTFSPRATLQWWMEATLLAGFAMALMRLRIPRREFTTWFVISLVPHALLALRQSFAQTVVGIKWLGMAAQDPLMHGVSVIEDAGRRTLRAYGGFPHPNILGGWLAVGITAILVFYSSARKKMERQLWLVCIGLFSSALILSFSRSAWVAATAGVAAALITERRGRATLLLAMMATAFLTVWIAREPLLARMNPDARLETKSIGERGSAWRQGWSMFREHPFVGFGPGAAIFALSREEPWSQHRASLGPPIPPHNVPQLILIELGILGLFGAVILFFFSHSRLLALSPMLAILLVLSMFDHYPWSLWSGKTLALSVFLLTFLPF